MTITAPTGVLLPMIQPGSDEWMRRMSASKVAAVIGLSPYQSPFSLWHRMAGLVDPEPEKPEMRRGHYLEPACATWFADQHPTWTVTPTGTWIAADDDRWAASPDRLVTCDTGEARLVECKTEGDDENWGQIGTDEIPVHHRAQAQWQMLVTGLRVCHFSVLTKYLEFREYVVGYDQADVDRLVTAADEFMQSLPGGARPRRPALDSHSATYQVVRELHPDIDGPDFEVPLPLAEKFCTAQHALKAAKNTEQAARTELADAMGSAKRARYADLTIADRRSKAGGVPYLQAASVTRLPRFDSKAA